MGGRRKPEILREYRKQKRNLRRKQKKRKEQQANLPMKDMPNNVNALTTKSFYKTTITNG